MKLVPLSGLPQPSVTVILPVHNARKDVAYALGRLPRDVTEVILVDSGSTDRTVEVATDLWPSLVVVRQSDPGRAGAVLAGLAAATGDVIVVLDVPGRTDAASVSQFVETLVAGADVAKGVSDGASQTLSRMAGRLFGVRLRDLTNRNVGLWRRVLPGLNLPTGTGLDVDVLLTMRVASKRLRIEEVPVRVPARRSPPLPQVLRTVVAEYRRHREVRAANQAEFVRASPVLNLPRSLEREVEALRSYNRHRVPAPGVYAAAASASTFQASQSLPDMVMPPIGGAW